MGDHINCRCYIPPPRCTCPRPTIYLDRAIDRLNEHKPSAARDTLIERYRQQIGAALVERDTACPVCLGSITVGL